MKTHPIDPTAIHAVFLDAVGTLLHPDPPAAQVYFEVGRRHGSRLDASVVAQRFAHAFRRQDEADHATGLRTDEAHEEARWRAIVAEVLSDVSDAEACFVQLHQHFAQPQSWACAPGTAQTLATLSDQGYQLGIASNFDSRLRRVATGIDALRPLRHLVISTEVGWRKPAPAFFVELCRRTGLLPQQILFLGDDAVNDYQGARAAGLQALLLDPDHRCPVGPEARLRSLSELTTRQDGSGG